MTDEHKSMHREDYESFVKKYPWQIATAVAIVVAVLAIYFR